MIYDTNKNPLNINLDLAVGQSQTINCLIECADGKSLSAAVNENYKIEARVGASVSFTNLMEEAIDLGAIAATQPPQTADNLYQEALFMDQLFLVAFQLKITALSSAFTAENLVLIID